jgi:hypothetical protein
MSFAASTGLTYSIAFSGDDEIVTITAGTGTVVFN